MKNINGDASLIVLNVPPSLEESVVDWLLAREGATGFTSFPVFGHSTSHDHLSPAEQVSGRQRRQQVQIQVSQDAVNSFLADASNELGGADIHFWVMPLFTGGQLNKNARTEHQV